MNVPATLRGVRWVGIPALFAWTLAVTLWRSHTLPNDYARAHWLLTWDLGFVKRGLPGTILAGVAGIARFDLTASIVNGVSLVLFALFCGGCVAVAIRLFIRSDRQPAVMAAALVFFSTPFFVMQMHVVGYYDPIVLSVGVASVVLVARGHHWSAAVAQCVALLVHEQSLVLAWPSVVLATLLLQTRHAQGRVLWQQWAAAAVPVLCAAGLAGVWQYTTTPAVIDAFARKLQAVDFVGANRDTWAPNWIFRSFGDSIDAETRFTVARLSNPALLQLVLPSVLTLLCAAVECFDLSVVSLEFVVLAGVAAAPQAMHLIAWDSPRIWTYTSATAFMGLWVCSEVLPPRRAMRPIATLTVGTWAVVAQAFTRTRLLDVPYERWEPLLRALWYAPPIAAVLYALMHHGVVASQAGGPARSAQAASSAHGAVRGLFPVGGFLLAAPFAVGLTHGQPTFISLLLLLAAAVIYWQGIATSPAGALLGVGALLCSMAFSDAVAADSRAAAITCVVMTFLATWWSAPDRSRWLWLGSGLLLLTRPELGIAMLPMTLSRSVAVSWERASREAAVGLAPVAAWAVAAPRFGVPVLAAWAPDWHGAGGVSDGLAFLFTSVLTDPATLLIVLAAVVTLRREDWRASWPVGCAVVLSVAYVVARGGGFPGGAGLFLPVVCSAALLARIAWTPSQRAMGLLLLSFVCLGTAGAGRPALTTSQKAFRAAQKGVVVGRFGAVPRSSTDMPPPGSGLQR